MSMYQESLVKWNRGLGSELSLAFLKLPAPLHQQQTIATQSFPERTDQSTR